MKHEPIHHLFSQKAAEFPQKLAIECGKRAITYLELEQKTNQIGNILLDIGIKKETPVAILLADSIDIMSALLGVLKSGNAFVTLDPEMPEARLVEMVEQTQPRAFLTQTSMLSKARSLRGDSTAQIILFDDPGESTPCPDLFSLQTAALCSDSPAVEWDPDGLCYVFFTSGSTGKIKGVAGRLKSIDHFIRWEIETFGVDETCRVSQLTLPSFDAFLRDMFVPLCSGGTVCVPENRQTVLDPSLLMAWLENQRVQMIHCVPTIFRSLLQQRPDSDRLRALKYIMLAGEALVPADCAAWMDIFGERIQLINFYGATETTMIKFFYRVTSADRERRSMPIGQPMKGARALVLDANSRPSPQGSVGEIYVRTPYRSLGYYKQPELTEKVFIQNPFSDKPNDLLYRTGDYGRILNDGNYEFLGRIDHQVKIRGLRVEPGEIEALLARHVDIKETVVIVRDNLANEQSEKQLVAYVVGDGRQPDSNLLQQHLLKYLPVAMVPSLFVVLDELPRGISGKVDRKALPAPASFRPEQTYEAPHTPTQIALAKIWKDVLNHERVGISDNFFALGGQSLLATQVVSRIQERLGVDIRLTKLFSLPTITMLAEYLEKQLMQPGAPTEEIPLTVQAQDTAHSPLSFAQERLWFLRQLVKDSAVYNLGFFFEARGSMSLALFEQAQYEIIERHSVLRTSFTTEGDQLRQIVNEPRFVMPVIDFSGISECMLDIRKLIDEEITRSYDLSKGPLLRVSLFRLGPEHSVICFCVHHIAFDGWSSNILFRETVALYGSLVREKPSPLPDLVIQYADYARWQREWFQGETRQQQIDYWKSELEGAPHFLELPYDRPRQPQQTFKGRKHSFTIARQTHEKFRDLCRQEGNTEFMGLLAVYGILLRWFSGKEDFLVGTDVANRNRLETESLIGFFVNQLALRCRLHGDPSFRELMAQARRVSLDGYNNQDLPFHMLVGELNPERKNYAPLFQVKLVLQNQPQELHVLDGLKLDALPVPRVAAQLDMVLTLDEGPDGLHVQYGYNSDLFQEKTVIRLSLHFESILSKVISDPDLRLSVLLNTLNSDDQVLKKAGRDKFRKSATRQFKNIEPVKSFMSSAQGKPNPDE